MADDVTALVSVASPDSMDRNVVLASSASPGVVLSAVTSSWLRKTVTTDAPANSDWATFPPLSVRMIPPPLPLIWEWKVRRVESTVLRSTGSDKVSTTELSSKFRLKACTLGGARSGTNSAACCALTADGLDRYDRSLTAPTRRVM